jgi:uroporphyrin-III C-methyltransferase/precorrin-2 dehydrogenase/sirohydrochlorin ferrochelatase
MEFLPLHHDVKGQPCLVAGGGVVALRKVRLLLRAGASIRVISPEINQELVDLLDDTSNEYSLRSVLDSDVKNVSFIIAATDDESVNHHLSALARQRKIPINVVDNPGLSSFIFPSIVDRSPVIISVSSSARSPVLTRFLRTKIEALLPSTLGQFAEFLGRFRDKVRRSISGIADRRHFWESVVDSPIAELMYSGRHKDAELALEKAMDTWSLDEKQGEVYLVGAGPGDPDLLTLRAVRLMQQADIVLYDNLVAEKILDLVRKDAGREYVGKRRADHALPQEEINDKLVRLAREGYRVLRLKGGDPFIFGRGGEEIEKLAENNIPFQVVPGITAASGCASYAGIPLTHRDYSQSVRFVTGHPRAGEESLQWQELVHENQTIVFYMGLAGLEDICQNLIAHGKPQDTPIALISKGTTPEQRIFTSTLKKMPQLISASDVHAPTLIIVGDVVMLRDRLMRLQE